MNGRRRIASRACRVGETAMAHDPDERFESPGRHRPQHLRSVSFWARRFTQPLTQKPKRQFRSGKENFALLCRTGAIIAPVDQRRAVKICEAFQCLAGSRLGQAEACCGGGD